MGFSYISIGDIECPQMLRVPVVGGVLDIYTGWATIVLDSGDKLRRETIYSLVPTDKKGGVRYIGNSLYGVQEYAGPELHVTPIITASLASFGQNAEVAAVDDATVDLLKVSFKQGSAGLWLQMQVSVAVANGVIQRFAYQVTVFVSGPPATIAALGGCITG